MYTSLSIQATSLLLEITHDVQFPNCDETEIMAMTGYIAKRVGYFICNDCDYSTAQNNTNTAYNIAMLITSLLIEIKNKSQSRNPEIILNKISLAIKY